MSLKRQATSDLNHENWDKEEKEDHEMGSYKIASEDVLEKRVIRTAKRRFQNSGSEAKKPVFSGFGGFNKTQPSSFDFLANLTNNSKTNNVNATTTTASSVSSNPFGNALSNSIFTSPVSSTNVKPSFGKPTESASIFGASTSSTSASIFTTPKADTASQNGNLFKAPAASVFSPNSSNPKSLEPDAERTDTASTMSATASSSKPNKSLFTSGTPSKLQTTSSKTTSDSNTKPEDKSHTSSKLKYYGKLKGLNESVSDWIKKHVEEAPLCILTPIFQGYEKHLKQIQEEYENDKKEEEKASNSNASPCSPVKEPQERVTIVPKTNFGLYPPTTEPSELAKSLFGVKSTQSSNFSFGFTSSPGTNTNSSGFKFGVSSTQSTSTTTSPFVTSISGSSTNGKAPFSFGTDKPFSFNSNIQVAADSEKSNDNNDEEDEPPKVEFTPIVEENSVFDKKCKIFVKKDGNFVDNGVGTLYIKKIQDSEKHQLLVRANTSLGNILLNLILSSAIPTQLMGKNNVMLVCIPNPEAKPPPVPILIRVKTSEEAEELLNTLNKYKG